MSGPLSEQALRNRARSLIRSVVPFGPGEPGYHEVCKFPEIGTGASSSLCHWLLYRLGAVNPHIVNWTDPSRGLAFVPGANIRRIYHQGRRPFWSCNSLGTNALLCGVRPRTGDIVVLNQPGGSRRRSHIFVFLDETHHGNHIEWTTAESSHEGGLDAKIRKRALHLPLGADFHRDADVTIGDSGDAAPTPTDRVVTGWLPLTLLDYRSPP
ncbi:hypothetical protein D3874_16960 [Oleomonas cavernae]|uniref:CHAP domain-containing protein n=1 Tax=Oleomonas cavernae TaxID=2320859 RepID=A0A418WEY6_9PROT|nr:hypothetical protein [Oleomonas cavernae]RJF88489.1 hypothetical protein D3874_16960 [Oleomonas cavernae]